MATKATIDNDLEKLIAIANSADELIPLLNQIPLNILKQTLTSEISRNYPTPSHQIKLKFGALFFCRLIPDDILQYILSFLCLANHKNYHNQVCTKWNRLYNQNQKLFYKPYIGKYQQMWIFDSRRKNSKLTALEKTLGIKGVVDDLRNILNSTIFMELNLQDEAIIFVHAGTQELEEEEEDVDDGGGVLTFKRNCTLIGVNYTKNQLVEVSATINGQHYDSDLCDSNPADTNTGKFICIGSHDETGKCKVKLEGINFNNNFMSSWGDVNQGCCLTISNCVMFARDGGITHYGDELKIDGCHIQIGGVCVVIKYYSDNINVRNSTLSNTYSALPCIKFDGHQDRHDLRKLNCNGNTFISGDEHQFPIADSHDKKVMGYLSQNKWIKLNDSNKH